MSNPNAPDRFLTWRWPQDPPEDDPEYGEFDYNDPNIPKRLTYTKDSKKPNTGIFVLTKEGKIVFSVLFTAKLIV
ncbi:hypothetical protein EON65_38020 [archaeon]|nr:MAG: hypothetical protein EON65_38020 [archaeon]